MSKAIAAQPHLGRSRGCGRIFLHRGRSEAQFAKAPQNFAPQFVLPHPSNGRAVRAERVRMIGKVGGSAAHLRAGRKQIPKHLADPNDIESRVHSSIGDESYVRVILAYPARGPGFGAHVHATPSPAAGRPTASKTFLRANSPYNIFLAH